MIMRMVVVVAVVVTASVLDSSDFSVFLGSVTSPSQEVNAAYS